MKTGGEAALTFIDTRDVWLNANFRENSLEKVKPGDPVELVLDTLPGVFSPPKFKASAGGYRRDRLIPTQGLPKIDQFNGTGSLGLGISPLPEDSGSIFIARIFDIMVACAYAIGMKSAFDPKQTSALMKFL